MFRRPTPRVQQHSGRQQKGAADRHFFSHRRHRSSRSGAGGSLRLIDSLLTDRSGNEVWRSRAWRCLAPLWTVGGAVGLVLLWPGRWRRYAARLGCCLAVTLLAATAGRAAMLVASANGLSAVLYRLNFATLSLEALGGATLLLRMQFGRLQSFIFLWSQLHKKTRPHTCHAGVTRLLRWGLLATGTFALSHGCLEALAPSPAILLPLGLGPMVDRLLNALLSAITSFYAGLVVQLLPAAVCFILLAEFGDANAQLSEAVKSLPDAPQRLRFYRHRHFRVIRLTELADAMLGYTALLTFSLAVPTLCADIFVLLTPAATAETGKVAVLLWTLLYTVQIFLVSWPPAAVHTEAHAALPLVEEVSNRPGVFDSADRFVVYRQISLFTRQLTGKSIAITAGGFFYITNSIILTLVSVMITYLALIIQLNSSTVFVCDCNCAAPNQSRLLTNATGYL